jgi:hypothetical protein
MRAAAGIFGGRNRGDSPTQFLLRRAVGLAHCLIPDAADASGF